MRLVFKCLFGSHLYGTNTPQSDRDYKAICIAEFSDIILKRDKETIQENTKSGNQFGVRNTKNDTDCEYIELRKFIKDAKAGQTYALDMLFSPRDFWIEHSPIWLSIVENRDKLLSRDVSPFIGYCRQQAGKYGLKGSRLSELIRVIDHLEKFDSKAPLGECLEGLELTEFVKRYKTMAKGTPDREEEFLDVLGKKFQMNTLLHRILFSLEKMNAVYGDRAKQAAKNEGVDWKAISHAYRCCYQLLDLANNHKITFPLKEAEYLIQIKKGEIPYSDLGDELYELMERSKKAIGESSLPEKCDSEFWDNFLINTYLNTINDV